MKGCLETILVVEDHDEVRQMLEALLAHEGFRVLTATNGAEAFRVINHEVPDLIVLDLMLPWISGVEVLEQDLVDPPLVPHVAAQSVGVRLGDRAASEDRGDQFVDRSPHAALRERLRRLGQRVARPDAENPARASTP